MLALLSVWVGLGALLCSVMMLLFRSLFTDVMVVIALYAGIFSLTFAGLSLWSLRKQHRHEAGVTGQRIQCGVGIGLSLVGICVVYGLVAWGRG